MSEFANSIFNKFEQMAGKFVIPGDGVLSNKADICEYEICEYADDIMVRPAHDIVDNVYKSYRDIIALHYGMQLSGRFTADNIATTDINSIAYALKNRISKPDALCGDNVICALVATRHIKSSAYQHLPQRGKICKVCVMKNSTIYNAEFVKPDMLYIMDAPIIDVSYILAASTRSIPIRILIRVKSDISSVLAYEITKQ